MMKPSTLRAVALPSSTPIRQIGLIFLGTGLLVLSAKTKVILGPVDISLQTLAIMIVGLMLGLRLGALTVMLYLFQGAMGLPVFQGTPERGLGLVYMVGPTGGYLLGFLAMVCIVGWAADRGWHADPIKLAGAILLGEAAMMTLGYLWLSTIVGYEKAWFLGVQPFLLGDMLKVAMAVVLASAVTSLRCNR